MPTVFALVPEPKRAFLNSVGDPASGYKLFVYTAGSATKATTYTESDGNTANSNPVVLDSRGEPPSGVYAESGTYKMVLAAGTDTDPPTSPVWTRDNVSPINDTSTTVDQFAASGLTPTFVSSTQFTLVGDQRSTFHVGRRLKTANSAGTAYHTITASTYSAPNTTVTVANDSTVLDSGLSTVSLSILTADSSSSIPGVEIDEDDWTHQGDVTVEGALAVTGNATVTGGVSGATLTQNGKALGTSWVKQQVHVSDGAVATGTTVMPIDDTIPQITEGDQFMSLAITPTNASHILVIDVVCVVANGNTNTRVAAALFQDATAGALAATVSDSAATTTAAILVMRHRMVAGTTSATTFRVRAGGPTAGTTTFNGATGGRLFGGVMASSITITEYVA